MKNFELRTSNEEARRARRSTFFILTSTFFILLLGCDRPSPLTAEKAQQIVSRSAFKAEPVYAEVPQRVWWNTAAPKDEYDERALRTLRHLEQAGLVTITSRGLADGGEEYLARVTPKGFPILGTAPSYRGPVYRGMIAEKKYDGLRDFVRHPTEPTVGHAKLVWHYDNPTSLYPMFETKQNKPLKKPFASHISFYFKDSEWRFNVNVKKSEAL
jgi:hypothetical protein